MTPVNLNRVTGKSNQISNSTLSKLSINSGSRRPSLDKSQTTSNLIDSDTLLYLNDNRTSNNDF